MVRMLIAIVWTMAAPLALVWVWMWVWDHN